MFRKRKSKIEKIIQGYLINYEILFYMSSMNLYAFFSSFCSTFLFYLFFFFFFVTRHIYFYFYFSIRNNNLIIGLKCLFAMNSTRSRISAIRATSRAASRPTVTRPPCRTTVFQTFSPH